MVGDNVEASHGVVWAVSLTGMEAAVPSSHAALAPNFFLFVLFALDVR
jgi:hypothetical protein